ncbi:anti-phage protein KwaA [Paenibacillus sp. MMS18-CY102]|uniref:anti-phage protein KwaA n=1 Tax=Paenibacillus sp. MMS18-CY102 TaxID=2682849 RepID=UPI003FA68E32
MRSWVRAMLFFSSLSPLFFILWIQTIEFDYLKKMSWKQVITAIYELNHVFSNNIIAISFMLFTISPNIILFIVFMRCKRYGSYQTTVTSITAKNSDVLNYIATYLIPFVTFNTDKLNDLISFIVLMLVLTVVYVNANIFFINPLLNLFGYHVYQINENSIIITKVPILVGMKLDMYTIQDNVFLGER